MISTMDPEAFLKMLALGGVMALLGLSVLVLGLFFGIRTLVRWWRKRKD
jgi:hypothetical protein